MGVLESCHLIPSEDFAIPQSLDNHLLASYADYEKMVANVEMFVLVFLTILGMELLFRGVFNHLTAAKIMHYVPFTK